MRGKLFFIPLNFLLIIALLSGCSTKDLESQLADKNSQIDSLTKQVSELNSKISSKETSVKSLTSEKIALEANVAELQNKLNKANPATPLDTSLAIVKLIKAKDMSALSGFVHPDKGVRFSPYGYVDVKNNLKFNASEVAGLLSDTKSYLWGNYDGSGEPIQLNFSDYYAKFVYDVDFSNPQVIGNNNIIGTGNSLINIDKVYPGAAFVEFHFKGFDQKYNGMDWRSLRLVLEEKGGKWYLTGIIHDQWTI